MDPQDWTAAVASRMRSRFVSTGRGIQRWARAHVATSQGDVPLERDPTERWLRVRQELCIRAANFLPQRYVQNVAGRPVLVSPRSSACQATKRYVGVEAQGLGNAWNRCPEQRRLLLLLLRPPGCGCAESSPAVARSSRLRAVCKSVAARRVSATVANPGHGLEPRGRAAGNDHALPRGTHAAPEGGGVDGAASEPRAKVPAQRGCLPLVEGPLAVTPPPHPEPIRPPKQDHAWETAVECVDAGVLAGSGVGSDDVRACGKDT